jgi:hypothetical protein
MRGMGYKKRKRENKEQKHLVFKKRERKRERLKKKSGHALSKRS